MSGERYVFSGKVAVGASGRKGRGMFATRPIRRGEVIEAAPALLIPRDQSHDLLASFLSHYIFRTDTGRRYVVGLGYTSLFNHGDRPNAEFYAKVSLVKIKAVRAIATGEEVTVSYGWTVREWADAGGRAD